jgi:hypothetical protein
MAGLSQLYIQIFHSMRALFHSRQSCIIFVSVCFSSNFQQRNPTDCEKIPVYILLFFVLRLTVTISTRVSNICILWRRKMKLDYVSSPSLWVFGCFVGSSAVGISADKAFIIFIIYHFFHDPLLVICEDIQSILKKDKFPYFTNQMIQSKSFSIRNQDRCVCALKTS